MRRATSSLLFIIGFHLFVPIALAQTFDKDVSALVDKVSSRAIEIGTTFTSIRNCRTARSGPRSSWRRSCARSA